MVQAITRRDFLRAAVGGALTVSSLRCGLRKSEARGMNVVLIMTDQQPVNTLGSYGNPLNPTPNLDRLARSGLRFTNAYIGAFPCSPSRATLFTGCYPQCHGVYTNDVPLEDDVPSLGFIMHGSKRATAFYGKSHLKGHMYRDEPGREPYLGSWFLRRVPDDFDFKFVKMLGGEGEDNPQLGFDKWAGGWKDYHAYLKEAGLGCLLEKTPWPGNHNDLPSASEGTHMSSLIPEEHHTAAFLTNKAVEYIRSRHESRYPFAMVLSFYGPHLPVAPPRPWDEKYALDQCPLPINHSDTLEGKPREQRENRVCYKLPEWTPEQFQDYIRRYYGYCAYLDNQIGRVLDALRDSGFEDNTIVIFTSDHGDLLAAHGSIYKMETCGYQELANIPLILRVPSVTQPGSVTETLVSLVDILPTLVDLLGLPRLRHMQGTSFRKTLADPESGTRSHVFIHWGTTTIVNFDGRLKYNLHWKSATDELYDLGQDPGEMINLAWDKRYSEIARAKRQEIFDWLQDTGHPYADIIRRIKQ